MSTSQPEVAYTAAIGRADNNLTYADRLQRERVSTAMEILAIVHTRDRTGIPPSLVGLYDAAVATLIKALENTHGE